MANGKNAGSEYEVGKNKPPVHSRFTSENQPVNKGHPKGPSIKTILRKLLETPLKNEPDFLLEGNGRDMTAGEKMALNLLQKAIVDCDLKAIQLAMEHLEGKPAQALKLGGDEDNDEPIKSALTVTLVRPKGSVSA